MARLREQAPGFVEIGVLDQILGTMPDQARGDDAGGALRRFDAACRKGSMPICCNRLKLSNITRFSQGLPALTGRKSEFCTCGLSCRAPATGASATT